MRGRYLLVFLGYALSFLAIAVHLIQEGFRSVDLALFCLFVLLSMVALTGKQDDRTEAWILSLVLFAFLLAYLLYLFLNANSFVLFVLVVLNVVAFLTCLRRLTATADVVEEAPVLEEDFTLPSMESKTEDVDQAFKDVEMAFKETTKKHRASKKAKK